MAHSIQAILFIALLVFASAARGQDMEPRSYSNIPVGMNFALVGYAYTTGDVAFDASSPLEDGEVVSNTAVLGYVRSLNLFGDSGKIDVVVPYADVSGSATFNGETNRRDVDGFGDPQVRLSWNFYGAPSMTLEELREHPSDLIAGASMRVGIPVGQYDADKLLNIGTNRWLFKPEVGISKALGHWILEADVSATFFTDNDDFFGGATREQDPIYAVQAHVIYNFPKGFWVGLDGTYYNGGKTTTNGVEGDSALSNSRIGLTIGVPLSIHNSLKFYASTGTSSETGDNFTTTGIIWQYRWGGGIH